MKKTMIVSVAALLFALTLPETSGVARAAVDQSGVRPSGGPTTIGTNQQTSGEADGEGATGQNIQTQQQNNKQQSSGNPQGQAVQGGAPPAQGSGQSDGH